MSFEKLVQVVELDHSLVIKVREGKLEEFVAEVEELPWTHNTNLVEVLEHWLCNGYSVANNDDGQFGLTEALIITDGDPEEPKEGDNIFFDADYQTKLALETLKKEGKVVFRKA